MVDDDSRIGNFSQSASSPSGFEVRFGIIFLSRTKPIGSLFCRSPYAIAASEVAVECLVNGEEKVIPVSTLRALVAVTFAPEEH